MSQLRTGLRWGLGLLVAVGLLGVPAAAPGQDDPTSRASGTAVEFALALNAYAFEASETGAQLLAAGIYRSCASPCVLLAPVTLPSGALLMGVELDALDAHINAQVVASLLHCPRGIQFCTGLATTSTGVADAPGVTQVRRDLASPHSVDNGANTYVIQASLPAGSPSSLALIGLRVFYRLQVSPAPAVATFSDVPTSHPFFQFVEALAGSGITVGCGVGIFCPDAPLTRGQMAVFLSRGLGLHFAP